MRKALSLPLALLDPAGLYWALLLGELGAAFWLAKGGHIAPVATRALQLFLRF
jgi:hypothetical protein